MPPEDAPEPSVPNVEPVIEPGEGDPLTTAQEQRKIALRPAVEQANNDAREEQGKSGDDPVKEQKDGEPAIAVAEISSAPGSAADENEEEGSLAASQNNGKPIPTASFQEPNHDYFASWRVILTKVTDTAARERLRKVALGTNDRAFIDAFETAMDVSPHQCVLPPARHTAITTMQ
jgi:hypothetical protein